MLVTRLRQVVVAARERDLAARQLVQFLELGEPFADEAVAEFGLHNAVFALGDTFIEVVSPTREGTTAGRFIDKQGGDAGYMVIVQVESMPDARRHLEELAIRSVWQVDLDEVLSTHIHPADIGAAIVSIEEPRPASSWLWGGPEWPSRSSNSVATGVAGVTITAPDPMKLADRWAEVLNTPHTNGVMTFLDKTSVNFVLAQDGRTRIDAYDLWSTAKSAVGREARIANTTFRLVNSHG